MRRLKRRGASAAFMLTQQSGQSGASERHICARFAMPRNGYGFSALGERDRLFALTAALLF